MKFSYIVIAADGYFNQFKGNNSCITDVIRTKLNVHLGIMMARIKYKCHPTLFIDFLVMAPDGHLILGMHY